MNEKRRKFAEHLADKLIAEYPAISFGELVEKGMDAQAEACRDALYEIDSNEEAYETVISAAPRTPKTMKSPLQEYADRFPDSDHGSLDFQKEDAAWRAADALWLKWAEKNVEPLIEAARELTDSVTTDDLVTEDRVAIGLSLWETLQSKLAPFATEEA